MNAVGGPAHRLIATFWGVHTALFENCPNVKFLLICFAYTSAPSYPSAGISQLPGGEYGGPPTVGESAPLETPGVVLFAGGTATGVKLVVVVEDGETIEQGIPLPYHYVRATSCHTVST